jgi:predicted 2-oxoglutarate/Fe(II)-dependent dioxygenase YbiX
MYVASHASINLMAGDRAPNCIGVTSQAKLYSFESQAGRPVALIAARDVAVEGLIDVLAAFSAALPDFHALDADVVVLFGDSASDVFEFALEHPLPLTLVGNAAPFLQAIQFASELPEVIVLDRNARAVQTFRPNEPGALVAGALAALAGLPTEAPRDIVLPAPVLILPNVLNRPLCAELIQLHRNSGAFDSGFVSTDAEGNSVVKIDHSIKKRKDILLPRDNEINIQLSRLIMDRITFEVKRAFQADITHMDRLLISAYDDTGGHFKRHRDDFPAKVAFRQFALSINLNTDDYEGGYLSFPEYNSHRYRAPTGAAVIFSAKVLHEVSAVTKGERYALLSFMHNDAGEAQRLAIEGPH